MAKNGTILVGTIGQGVMMSPDDGENWTRASVRQGMHSDCIVRALAQDISVLIVPSPERALALDRGYLALVRAQSFEKGRDVILDGGVGGRGGQQQGREQERDESAHRGHNARRAPI